MKKQSRLSPGVLGLLLWAVAASWGCTDLDKISPEAMQGAAAPELMQQYVTVQRNRT